MNSGSWSIREPVASMSSIAPFTRSPRLVADDGESSAGPVAVGVEVLAPGAATGAVVGPVDGIAGVAAGEADCRVAGAGAAGEGATCVTDSIRRRSSNDQRTSTVSPSFSFATTDRSPSSGFAPATPAHLNQCRRGASPACGPG